jgi:hypothetical protein
MYCVVHSCTVMFNYVLCCSFMHCDVHLCTVMFIDVLCASFITSSNNTHSINLLFHCYFNCRYRCNFGPEDRSDIVAHDMQALLKSTQKKKKILQNKKRGKKVIPEYDSFPMTTSTRPKVARIGKTLAGNSVKRGCQRCFVAKKPYLDHSLCLLIYENAEHCNTAGEHCHGTMVGGFRYALGAGLSIEMKQKIAQMHAYGLSPAQIMQQHTKEVRKLAVSNGLVTRDTFLLPSDVRNICRKRAEDLWEKHPSDPISVRMWAAENPDSVFYYQEHSLLDLNSRTQDDSPFTIGIQTEWQLEMMANFGHNSALSIDATFGTSQTRVRSCSARSCSSIIVYSFQSICFNHVWPIF